MSRNFFLSSLLIWSALRASQCKRAKMSAQPLSSLTNTVGLRDRILSAYESFKGWKGAGYPDRLLYTHAHDGKSTSPMHRAGKAIDLVTDSWGTRRHLFEFGLYLWATQPDLTVHFYPVSYEPHVHIGEASGFGSGSYLVNVPGADRKKNAIYQVYKREEVPQKASEIIERLRKTYETYTAGHVIDWDYWREVLEGNETPPKGASAKVTAMLKKYWWVGAISIVLLGVVFIIAKMKKKGGSDEH